MGDTGSSSFLCSLADDELIEFINKLSQDKKRAKLAQRGDETEADTDVDTEDDSQAVNIRSDDVVVKRHDDNNLDISEGIISSTLITGKNKVSDTKAKELVNAINSRNVSGVNKTDRESRGISKQVTISSDPHFDTSDIPHNVPSDPRNRRTQAQIASSPISLGFAKYPVEDLDTSEPVKPSSEGDDILGSVTLAQRKKSTDSIKELEFGDYATYFKKKQEKQQIADDEFRKWEQERRVRQGLDKLTYPPLFRGCIIHVNGKTDPDISQLHKLVVLYGGVFLHYLGAKGNATHIIASKLTPRKAIEFRNYKVVTPDWITNSIEKKSLQHWMDYAVINNDYGQKRLEFQRIPQEPAEVFNSHERETIGEKEISPAAQDLSNNQEFPEKEVVEEDEFNLTPLTQEEPEAPQDQPEEELVQERGIVDARHPDFLKYFFSKSRLHHLSTWKADLKFEFLQKALAKQKSLPQTKSLKSSRTIMHIDFDCFFATVSALSNPKVQISKDPIAVTHGGNSADIASCNYVARKFGIKNGMWVRQARKLCPGLICLDYNFPEYERISKIFYDVMIDSKCDAVLPVSVDEVLIEVTSICGRDSEQIANFAAQIRETILTKTGCTVSVGAGANVLLAKLALRKSKPDGFYQVKESDNVNEFLNDILVRDLPGVGYSITSKLEREFNAQNVKIEFLRSISKEQLINLFGIKTGTKLSEYCIGEDNTDINIANNPSEYTRKSVSIDINWGIRFTNIQEVDRFLLSCANEMNSRLLKIKMTGSSITLKLARRSPGAPIEPPKYLGMGQCDFFTKTARFGVATREIGLISSEAKALFRILNVPIPDLRGVSIQIAHLVSDEVQDKIVVNQRTLPFAKMEKDKFLTMENKPLKKNNNVAEVSSLNRSDESSQYQIPSDVDSSVLQMLPEDIKNVINKKRTIQKAPVQFVPPQSQIDWEVFQQLPKEIQRELKRELKRREIPVHNDSPGKSVSRTPRKGKFELQPVFSKNGEDPKVIRIISPSKHQSPRKKFRGNSKSPQPVLNLELMDIDEEVLEELPEFIKNDIKQDLMQKFDKVTNAETDLKKLQEDIDKDLLRNDEKKIRLTSMLFNEMIQSQKHPELFQCDSFEKCKNKLIEMIRESVQKDGPDDEEVAALVRFMTKMVDFSLSNSIYYLKTIKSTLEIEERLCQIDVSSTGLVEWHVLYKSLKKLIDGKCFEKQVTYDL